MKTLPRILISLIATIATLVLFHMVAIAVFNFQNPKAGAAVAVAAGFLTHSLIGGPKENKTKEEKE
jgi:amino acid transporter